MPTLWERNVRKHLAERERITLIHGDAHLGNFLYPHDPEIDKLYIIDWEGWQISVGGTTDLAYMIALHWSPEIRHSMERCLIKFYYMAMLKHGVRNYSWDDCWHEYRLSTIGNLITPLWQWSAKRPIAEWWPLLENAILACQDLECAELMD